LVFEIIKLACPQEGTRDRLLTLQIRPSWEPNWLYERRKLPAEVGAWACADFRAFDSMGGPCPKRCHHDQHQELKELRYRVWINSVVKPLCAVFECLIVTFFDQVPGGKAIESFGIESKLAPSF
jgi:hypothetical protein